MSWVRIIRDLVVCYQFTTSSSRTTSSWVLIIISRDLVVNYQCPPLPRSQKVVPVTGAEHNIYTHIWVYKILKTNIVYPKQTRVIECTIQNAPEFWIMHSIAVAFLHTGSGNYLGESRCFKKYDKSRMVNILKDWIEYKTMYSIRHLQLWIKYHRSDRSRAGPGRR